MTGYSNTKQTFMEKIKNLISYQWTMANTLVFHYTYCNFWLKNEFLCLRKQRKKLSRSCLLCSSSIILVALTLTGTLTLDSYTISHLKKIFVEKGTTCFHLQFENTSSNQRWTSSEKLQCLYARKNIQCRKRKEFYEEDGQRIYLIELTDYVNHAIFRSDECYPRITTFS